MAEPESPSSVQPAPAAPEPSLVPVKVPVEYIWGTGRRKKAVARVRIRSGSGKILINRRSLEEYFKGDADRLSVRTPLEVAKLTAGYDVWANVNGGGATGQADAIKLGLARALIKAVPEIAPVLREQGLLTRDPRMKERKKYGQKGARKRFQYSKR
jgi:small subunit ribosomal protein S9